jgi:hypothetical protein
MIFIVLARRRCNEENTDASDHPESLANLYAGDLLSNKMVGRIVRSWRQGAREAESALPGPRVASKKVIAVPVGRIHSIRRGISSARDAGGAWSPHFPIPRVRARASGRKFFEQRRKNSFQLPPKGLTG